MMSDPDDKILILTDLIQELVERKPDVSVFKMEWSMLYLDTGYSAYSKDERIILNAYLRPSGIKVLRKVLDRKPLYAELVIKNVNVKQHKEVELWTLISSEDVKGDFQATLDLRRENVQALTTSLLRKFDYSEMLDLVDTMFISTGHEYAVSGKVGKKNEYYMALIKQETNIPVWYVLSTMSKIKGLAYTFKGSNVLFTLGKIKIILDLS